MITSYEVDEKGVLRVNEMAWQMLDDTNTFVCRGFHFVFFCRGSSEVVSEVQTICIIPRTSKGRTLRYPNAQLV